MRQYEFIHLLWWEHQVFVPSIIRYINDPQNDFDVSQHLFVLTSKSLYDANQADNVILDTTYPSKSNCAALINKYAEYTDHLIVHSLCSPIELLKVKPKNLRKIVWRSWGHDAIFPYQLHKGKIMGNLVKRALRLVWKRQIKSFQMICGANLVDEVNFRDLFGDVRSCRFLYQILRHNETEPLVNNSGTTIKSVDIVNILVGHSGYSNDNHIAMLNKLMVYRNKPVQLHLVLSYGNKEYIDEVKKYAVAQWKDKVTIHDNFMPMEQYRELIHSMDLAIFDGINSYALSNIDMLLRAGKKLIVNPNGLIKRAFDLDSIPHLTSDTAFDLPFEEFIAPAIYTEESGKQLLLQTYEEKIQLMKRTFACIAECKVK